jgi:RNA polymerase Rpb2, domain 2.
VGRYKINQKLGINVDSSERILTDKDFIAAIKYLINLRRAKARSMTLTTLAAGASAPWANYWPTSAGSVLLAPSVS